MRHYQAVSIGTGLIVAIFLLGNTGISGLSAQEPSSTPIILPECLKSDINKDGAVDRSDLSILRDNFFLNTPAEIRSDINGDGFVDVADYSIMSTEYDISIYRPCQ